MKIMRCEVELYYSEDEIIIEELEVVVIGKSPDEDYQMIDEIIEDLLIEIGYSKYELENYDISFTLGSF